MVDTVETNMAADCAKCGLEAAGGGRQNGRKSKMVKVSKM